MNNTDNIEAGKLFYSVITEREREKDGFLSETIFTFQISGKLFLETANEHITTQPGDMLLVRKHQFVKVAKTPFDGEDYRTIIIAFNEDYLRNYALKQNIEIRKKYKGKQNVFIQSNEFFNGFFASILPYGEKPGKIITSKLGQLKVEEAIELLLQSKPELKEFLFDFSEPHKIDLERFMALNYQFNVPVEKFALLSGRSLAGFKRDFQKTFCTSPRKWLQEKRLSEAYYRIKNNNKKPSEIYLELGFESLSHFSNSFKNKYGVTPTQLM